MSRTFPNFIYAGAPKAGSSSIYELLRQHPDIYMSPVKEPFFFDFNYERGLDWYAEHFSGRAGEAAVGEATVWYMRWPNVPERINAHFPDMKFVFVLRDPADRVWSNYWHDYSSGLFDIRTSFSDAIRDEDDPRGMLMAGFYHDRLKHFESLFGKDNLLVLLTDDLRADPDRFFESIYLFLGVDADFRPTFGERKMVTAGPTRLPLLRSLHLASAGIRKTTGWAPAEAIWRSSRHWRSLFLSRRNRPPSMSDEDRGYLRELYGADTRGLADWMGRDLSGWLSR